MRTFVDRSLPVSPGGHLIIPGAILVLGLGIGWFVSVASTSLLVLGLGVVALGCVSLIGATRPRVVLAIVFASAMFSGLTLVTPLGVLRMDQPVAPAALLGVLLRVLAGHREESAPRRVTLSTWLLAGYVALNLLSTLLMSLNQAASLRIVLWLACSLATFLTTTIVATRFVSPTRIVRDVTIVGTAAAGLAVLLFMLARIGLFESGMGNDMAGGWTAKGTFWEANLLGSFAAMMSVMATSVLLQSKRLSGSRSLGWLVAVVICTVATVLSFSRAAWIGLVVGWLCVALFGRLGRSHAVVVMRAAILVALIGAIVVVLGLDSLVVSRFQSMIGDDTGTIAFRLADYSQVLAMWPQHPWFGFGTNTFGQYFLDATQNYAPAYLGGLFIATLWDVGLAGLICLALAFLAIGWDLYRGLRSSDTECRAVSVALSCALICALVAYQSTNGFWFSYNWLLMGLAVSMPLASSAARSSRGDGFTIATDVLVP